RRASNHHRTPRLRGVLRTRRACAGDRRRLKPRRDTASQCRPAGTARTPCSQKGVTIMDRHRPARPHYAWVILAVTGLTVVMTAGVPAVPAVLIHPLEVAFVWDRAAISLAVSIDVFLHRLAVPVRGRVVLRVGLRGVVIA